MYIVSYAYTYIYARNTVQMFMSALISKSMFHQQIQRFIINQHDNGLPLEAWDAINERNMIPSAKFETFDAFYYIPWNSSQINQNAIQYSLVRTPWRVWDRPSRVRVHIRFWV